MFSNSSTPPSPSIMSCSAISLAVFPPSTSIRSASSGPARAREITLAHVEAVERAGPRADLRGRWRAIATSFREWAREHPHEYALLYGSPVPEYDAPAERTTPSGTRVTNLLAAIGMEDPTAPPRTAIPHMPDAAELAALAVAAEVPMMDGERLMSGLLTWTVLVGAVSSELFEQLGESVARLDTLFDATVVLGEWLMFGDPRDESAGSPA